MKKNSFIVKKITQSSELTQAFAIRKKVFVEEQNVPTEEEYDQYEPSAMHFLAFTEKNEVACGTARWRFTEKGIKLERFAVLAEYRGQGVGQALMQAIINDIRQDEKNEHKVLYLHAQLTALGLYSKFGFEAVGEMFEECNIQHYKMIQK